MRSPTFAERGADAPRAAGEEPVVEAVDVVLVVEQRVHGAGRLWRCRAGSARIAEVQVPRRRDAGEREPERKRWRAVPDERADAVPLLAQLRGSPGAAASTTIELPKKSPTTIGWTNIHPAATDGMASATSGSVTTHGLSLGGPPSCRERASAEAATAKRGSPWKVMNSKPERVERRHEDASDDGEVRVRCPGIVDGVNGLDDRVLREEAGERRECRTARGCRSASSSR